MRQGIVFKSEERATSMALGEEERLEMVVGVRSVVEKILIDSVHSLLVGEDTDAKQK